MNMSIDDLLRVILGGGVVIENLTINTVQNQIIGDNAVIDARSISLPVPRNRPVLGGGVDYRYTHCAPSDYDPEDPNNVWQQMYNLRHNIDG